MAPARPKPGPYPRQRDRARGEQFRVISINNFKGGSGKTSTSTYLAQYLAMQGNRVLVVVLDPQASLSSLLGYQPEFDLNGNDTIYGAIRYDDEHAPLET